MTDEYRMLAASVPWENKSVEILAWLDGGDRLLQATVRKDDQGMAGDIYIGRVEKIMTGLNAAFIEIKPGVTAFYPMEDAGDILFTKKLSKTKPLCVGDELLVEVVRDPIKTKQAVCSTNLSFYGDDVILTTGKRGCGVSRKLPKEKRKELKELFAKETERFGLVFRTCAQDKTAAELEKEVGALREECEAMIKKASALTARTRLRRAKDPLLSFWERLPQKERSAAKEIVFEDPKLYQKAQKSGANFAPLRLYQDKDYPLWKLYGLAGKLQDACKPLVRMRSGASLVIEPTEALTAIDVNSGRQTKNEERSEYLLRINLEACDEIARQLRLRDLSGMILIDFINMDGEAQQEEVLQRLREKTSADPIPVQVVDYTRLGLAEVTRKKVSPSLAQQLLSALT